jgi:sortase A
MKKHLSTLLLFLVFFIGLSLLLYPTIADWWNSFHQSRAVASYVKQVANMDEDRYAYLWDHAWDYNQSLLERPNDYILTDEQKVAYEDLLDISDNGIMGYVEIPQLNIILPIYHGTGEAVLQVAVGHLEWTSLPVGGNNSHCVISGHRGLPSARLFTDLDQIAEGDVFLLRVLDEVLTYEVNQIRIVEPTDIQDLLIQEGEDLCTLMTCTPYGINSHRLLVRGRRIANVEEAKVVRVTADALQIEPVMIAPLFAAPLLLILLIMLMLPKKRRN